ncbi:olfactory receptor 1500-like [Pyxicephalus adspersus]|uniref:olfactory receptor 1500-like n=1 Tax=Pyxicephalus adspersus TaxID=30357 RepID=UPI003B5B2A76
MSAKGVRVISEAKLYNNQTPITEIILLGFQIVFPFQLVLFAMFLLLFCVTICGNFLLITLVSYSMSLQSPMYFFLTQLSISDILLSSVIEPVLLHVLLKESVNISFPNCIVQLYFFMLTEIYESVLLALMSYDRYVAICIPLRYNNIMEHFFCIKMILLLWLFSICITSILLITVCNLWFCGPNIIDHYCCDLEMILDLSCSDTSIVHMEMVLFSIPVCVFPFIVIIISYYFVIYTILRLPTTTSMQKAFSTCSSHLTVVFMFYGSLFYIYILPTKGQSYNPSKALSLLYTVVTPFLNPLIYSLKNKDIKAALCKFSVSISNLHAYSM